MPRSTMSPQVSLEKADVEAIQKYVPWMVDEEQNLANNSWKGFVAALPKSSSKSVMQDFLRVSDIIVRDFLMDNLLKRLL